MPVLFQRLQLIGIVPGVWLLDLGKRQDTTQSRAIAHWGMRISWRHNISRHNSITCITLPKKTTGIPTNMIARVELVLQLSF